MALLLVARVASLANSVDFTGYMVDTYCWDKPSHLAPPTRSLPLDIRPQNHTLQCMRDISVCFDGLTLLDVDSTTGLYYAKYQFGKLSSGVSVNVEGIGVLQTLLQADTRQITGDPTLTVSNGAPDLSVENGGTPMPRIHIIATADGSDPSQLRDITANVEGSARTFDKNTDLEGDAVPYQFGDSSLTVMYELSSSGDEVTFTAELMTNSGGWVGIGVSSDGTMNSGGAGSDIVICTADTLEVLRYWVTAKSRPVNGVPVPGASCTLSGGMQQMVFTRPLAAASATEREIFPSSPTIFLYAYSTTSTALVYHGGSKAPVSSNVATGLGGDVALSVPQLVALHAAFMLLGWGFLLPLGVVFARYFKDSDRKIAGKPFWFRAHQACQYTGWLSQLVGFAMIAAWKEDHFQGVGISEVHQILGMIVVVLGTLQPLNALVRPHPNEAGAAKSCDKRTVWEWLHKGTGRFCILAGLVNIVLAGVMTAPGGDKAFEESLSMGVFGFFGAISMPVLLLGVVKALMGMKKNAHTFDEMKAPPLKDMDMAKSSDLANPEL